MYSLQNFHDACASGELNIIKRFSNEKIKRLYDLLDQDESPYINKKQIANGLFWALIFGEFDTAKYLIEKGIFDPNELICGEIHILHILATFGGRDTETLKPWQATHYLLYKLYKHRILLGYIPSIIINIYEIIDDDVLEPDDEVDVIHIEYNEESVLEFTNWLLDSYYINVSVRTRQRWFDLDESQASIWYNFYKTIINSLRNTLKIHYLCYKFTPFHYACLFGRKSFVELLVSKGCDILCLGCNTICRDCPYNIVAFYNVYYYLDLKIDDFYGICYPKDTPDDLETQIDLIECYIKEDLQLILMEEFRDVKPFTLHMLGIEYISKKIMKGQYLKNISDITPCLKNNIKFYISIKYYKPKNIKYCVKNPLTI